VDISTLKGKEKLQKQKKGYKWKKEHLEKLTQTTFIHMDIYN